MDEGDYAHQHEPFAKGDCTACHDPHATNNRWSLVQSSQELCFDCHSKDGQLALHSHPYNVKPRQAHKYRELRLTEQGTLECLSCHDPHRSNTPHLLRTEHSMPCLGCHGDHQ